MWSKYYFNENNLVKVNFSGNIADKDDYNNFINQWKDLYSEKKNFSFVFDTINTSFVNPYYSYLMACFIKELKKETKQYLNFSVIIVKNYAIRALLNIIFAIQKPVAPVFLINNNDINKEIISEILNVNSEEELKILVENNKTKFSIVNV